jgi:hypothetical protein
MKPPVMCFDFPKNEYPKRIADINFNERNIVVTGKIGTSFDINLRFFFTSVFFTGGVATVTDIEFGGRILSAAIQQFFDYTDPLMIHGDVYAVHIGKLQQLPVAQAFQTVQFKVEKIHSLQMRKADSVSSEQ